VSTPLGTATKSGDVKTTKELLDKGADPCEEGSFGITPIHEAYLGGYSTCKKETYRMLINKAYDRIDKGGTCRNILFWAAGGGCNDIVEGLLKKGYNIEEGLSSKYYENFGPLAWAAAEGQLETVKLLLKYGANLDSAIERLNKHAAINAKYHYAENRVAYDKANKGLALLNQFIPKQIETKTDVATGGASFHVSKKSIIKSDIDELPVVKAKPNKNAYAIIIGIEQYRQKLPKADFAAHDAYTMTQYLTKVMGYPEENVITLLNDRASYVDLAKYFEKWLLNNVEKGSSVFIYFSGHGAPNPKTGDAYLVPYDGDPTFITETGYPITRLYESLGRLKAKDITVVLDSCFSGSGGRSVLAKGAKPLVMTINMPAIQKNMSVLTASSGDQISSAYEEKGHGLFTYYLLKGIKEKNVIQQDGSIAIGDLFTYLKPQVERIARKQYNNEQTPQLITSKKY
jgi:hypothetical protein